MATDDALVLLARLEERFRSLESRLDRHEVAMRDKLKSVDDVLDNLNRLALYGRVSLGIIVSVGTGVGWLIARWNDFRSAVGK